MSKKSLKSIITRSVLQMLEERFKLMYNYVTDDNKLSFQKFVVFVLNQEVNKCFSNSMREVIL